MSQGTGACPQGGPPPGNRPEGLLTDTATRVSQNHNAEREGPDTRARASRDPTTGKKGLWRQARGACGQPCRLTTASEGAQRVPPPSGSVC